MDNVIDKLQIEIEASTKDADKGLSKLQSSLKKLTELSNSIANMSDSGINKLKSMAESVNTLSAAGSNPALNTAISNLRKLARIDFSNLKQGSDKMSEIAAHVGGIAASPVTAAVPPAAAPLETITLEPRVEVEEATNRLSSFRDFASNVFANIKNYASSAFGKMGAAASGAFKVIGAGFKGMGKLAVSGLGKIAQLNKFTWGRFTGAVGAATKKFSHFTRAIGRIALYRAIRFVLSQITKAIKEGTDNAYQYSKAIGGPFAASMDKIASSFLYLKNSIGAAVSPLINALAPAIDYIIEKAVGLVNVLNQVFAKLSGASTWTKAINVQTEYAESAESAANAAKSLTAGFDELNVLSDTSSSGGGAGTPDYGSMFEEVPIDSKIGKLVDDVTEAFKEGDWGKTGKALGKKVNSVIEKADFEGTGEKVGKAVQAATEATYNFLDTVKFEGLGSGIAKMLNNLMDEIDFNLLGKTFGAAWNAIVDLIYGFVSDFDWSKFGVAIADFINGWFEEVDLTKTVKTIEKLLIGLMVTLQEAIRNTNWYQITVDIMDALEAIDWITLGKELGILASDAVIALLDILLAFVGETDWGKVVQDILAGIGALIANIDWSQILQKIGGVITEFIVQVPGIIVGALGGISDILGGIFEGFGLDSVAGFFYGIGEKMREANAWLKKNLVDPVVNFIKDLFGIHSPSTVFAEIGAQLIDGLFKGISETWRKIATFFTDKFKELKKTFSGAWESIKKTTSELWKNISTSVSETWKGIKKSAKETWDGLKTTVSDAWDNIKSNTSKIWDSVKKSLSDTWEGVSKTAKDTWKNIKETVGDTWDNVKTTTSDVWGKVKTSLFDTWESVKKRAGETWSGIKTSVSDTWDDIKTNTANKWEETKNNLSITWNGIVYIAERVFGSVKETVSGIWDKLESHISRVVESITGVVTQMSNVVSGVIEGIIRWFNNAIQSAQNAVQWISDAFSGIGSAASTAVNWIGGQLGFASGGFPEVGQLFIAREAGAEMVGSIGGRTAVANNDQIVEGIYQGVLAAMTAAGGAGGSDFNVNVYLDGKQITAAIEKRQRERGATIYPGGVLNGV